MKKFILIAFLATFTNLGTVHAAACIPGDTTKPTPVNNLTPVIVSSQAVIFSFTSPSDPSGISKYEIRYRIGGGISTLNWNAADTRYFYVASDLFEAGKTQIFKFFEITPGKNYSLALKVHDGCGNISNISNVRSFLTPTVQSNAILVFWEPVEGATSYTVYYSLTSRLDPTFTQYASQACINTTATSCTIIAPPGKTYYVTVKADNTGFGNEVSYFAP